MKDIKTLYNLAKSSKSNKEINEYKEAINTLLESNPTEYISNIEYIISSSIGLQTLNEFVDKYGLSIAYYDTLMEYVNNCIRKCEIYKHDKNIYNETLSFLESFRSKYENCFNMFDYFKDNLSDNYLNTYYGFNSNGIQNKKLISGMIHKFGEAAIPDILITSDYLGSDSINTTLKFLENNEIFNSPLTYQWIIESCNDLNITNNIHLENIKSKSAESIVDKMKQRNNNIYREAVIMNDREMILEYSEDEIDAVKDLISVREYQMLCTESYDRISSIQNEVYSLYEEFDGIEDDGVDPSKRKDFGLFGNRNRPIPGSDKYDVSAIKDKIIKFVYHLDTAINDDFREKIKEYNRKLPLFHRYVDRPYASIYIGDKYGPIITAFWFKEKDVFRFININKLDNEDEFIDGMKIWVKLSIYTYNILTHVVNKRMTNIFYDILLDSIDEDIKSKKVNIDPSDDREMGQISYKRVIDKDDPNSRVVYTYEWLMPLCIYKDYIIENKKVTESLSTVNTRNKKTGDIPDYLARNHDLNYGETDKDDKEKDKTMIDDKKDDKEPTEDDFIRPSAQSCSNNDGVNYDDLVVHGNDTSNKSNTDDDKQGDSNVDKGAVNNYYYYTYNNSLNKNSHSFNKDSSDHSDHSVHDRSNHTNVRRINDDHSKGKRTNSDDTKYYSDINEEDVTKENIELKYPWELDIFIEKKTKSEYSINALKKKYKYNPSDSTIEVDGNGYKVDLNINDKTLRNSSLYKKESPDFSDGKPESDHPIKDTFTDIDRVLVKKQQETKKKVQDIHNAGKAFIKPAIRAKETIANTIAKWKDNDETKLKERMADPVARKNLFSALKTSITIGSLAKAGLLFNPIFAFLAVTKHVGKNKREYRIRNEMLGELKTELEIIDEKIEDARRNGDNRQKYQLMRLKNEINKKIVRVGGGKGWKYTV